MRRTNRWTGAARRVPPGPVARHHERGDVPGWVLITLMTAALVSALWLVAEDRLVSLFQNALASVGG
jgi:hypothetical protein